MPLEAESRFFIMDPKGEDFDSELFRAVSRDLWEDHAAWWQENFTDGADEEYVEQIIPLAIDQLREVGATRVLDLGVGDGQVSRAARESLEGDVRFVGVDPAMLQLRTASERGGIDLLLRAEAKELPFGPSTFDAVMACLVFEHVVEFETAISEVSRVLEPGGSFLFFLNHPILQTPGSGFIDDVELGEQYWRIGPYLVEDLSFEEVSKDVFIPFVHRPISRYVNALAKAGMWIDHMAEPVPPEGFLDKAWEYRAAKDFPRLLFIRAKKVGGSVG